jgi:hypothetical protein
VGTCYKCGEEPSGSGATELISANPWQEPSATKLNRTKLFKSYTHIQERFQVLTAASKKIIASWDIAPCSIVQVGRRFGSVCYLHYQYDVQIIALLCH